MIIPTIPVKVWSVTGYDLHAQPILAAQPDEKICPVRLSYTVERTTVRTDAAASKGHAFENTAQVVILAVPRTKIVKGSRLELLEQVLRVVERHPRFTVAGVLDHYELHCDAWVL
jgi:hypothetical protein